MGSLDTQLEPLDVQVLEHEVVLLGSRVALAMSPDAAMETARRLLEAAAKAKNAATAQASHTLSRDA